MRWLLAALALVACGPNPPAPVQVMAVVQGVERYESAPVELKTVSDVVALRGSIAELIGGARIVVDSNDPLLQSELSDEQLARALVKAEGRAPRASYIDKDGLLWPADFHTWNMVTAYYLLERAFDYFQGAGVSEQELSGGNASRVYYFPTFILADQSPRPQSENAAFFSLVKGFLLLPFDEDPERRLNRVPLAMNGGVMAHEYSHRVFNERVYGGEATPEPIERWLSSSAGSGALNLLRSLDEGLADYHAHGATCLSPHGCDTRFLSASLGEAQAHARDIARTDLCMTAALEKALSSLGPLDFLGKGFEYQVGTLLASALYQAEQRTAQRPALQQAVIATYSDAKDPQTPGFAELIHQSLDSPEGFTLGGVANALVQHIGADSLKREVCNEFLDHLQVPRSELPACPAEAAGGNTCPKLR